MSNLSRSIIRKMTPVAAGLVVGLLAKVGIHGLDAQVTAYITSGAAAAYGALASWAETKVPALGWLLGAPGAPTYAPKPAKVFPTSEPIKK